VQISASAQQQEKNSMQSISFQDCTWLNVPKHFSANKTSLTVTTDTKTDFWRETHYGFIRDNGHFLGHSVTGDCAAQLRFRANYTHLYDQAGLMLRVDENNWIKTGIEFSDGKHALSTVVTSGKSDWSIGSLQGDPGDVQLRMTVSNGAVRIQASTDGKLWPVFRLLPFDVSAGYSIGPMCCSPERAGFKVEFSEFSVGPPLEKELHDLS
jgi:uncharacterized protein